MDGGRKEEREMIGGCMSYKYKGSGEKRQRSGTKCLIHVCVFNLCLRTHLSILSYIHATK